MIWSYHKQKLCSICKNKCISNIKIYSKIRDYNHCTGIYKIAARLIYNLWYKKINKIKVVLPNKSNYDYHLVTKELGKEFKEHFECFGENMEQYVTSSKNTKTK